MEVEVLMTEIVQMPLSRAMICLSCDQLFSGQNECPKCADTHTVLLSKWIKPLTTPRNRTDTGERP